MSTHYDVISIGTGPGGGTLAYKLAPSGKKILLLERGGYLPREKDNWNSKTVFIENRYKAKETRSDKAPPPWLQPHLSGATLPGADPLVPAPIISVEFGAKG